MEMKGFVMQKLSFVLEILVDGLVLCSYNKTGLLQRKPVLCFFSFYNFAALAQTGACLNGSIAQAVPGNFLINCIKIVVIGKAYLLKNLNAAFVLFQQNFGLLYTHTIQI
ncbi:MAG: hypothetical protein RSA17_07580, partial [Ruthenibacterium sp.]